MKIYGKRLTAALLTLCIALGLAACGSGGNDKGGDKEQISGTVYVPKFVNLKTDFDYISSGCCDGNNVYIVATISSEEEVTDPDTGETYINYDSKEGIYRVDMETGDTVELENYVPSYSFDSYDQGWFSIDGMSAGAGGTIWVNERASIYEYDLPEDFNEETDDKWQYQTGREVSVMRQLDSTGAVIQEVDTSGLREKMGENSWIYSTAVDPDGCIYTYASGEDGESVNVFDKDMTPLFTVDVDMYGEFFTLSDGSIAVRRRDQEGNMVVSTIDKAAKDWGSTEYPLPYAANNLYSGAGKYLFYYNSGESLYGYNAETQEGENLLSWSAADINKDQLVFFAFLPDGRVAAMTQDWGGENGRTVELALLTETEASAVAEKTILTYATMGLGSDMRSSIIKFNKSSDKYRIEIKDYSEYSTEDDYQAGLTKLNAEILAGSAPDILAVSNLPMRQYAAKGLLEDLWPFIDNDPDISRDSLMTRVFEAAEKDGKLYEAFESFAISTVIGAPDVVGDELGWTLEDMKAALTKMPEGCSIFSDSDTKANMLMYVLALNVDGYVDWETGECYFDSDQFKSALEFCNSFPLEYDWEANRDEYEDEPSRIAAGRQMLKTMTLDGFGDFQIYEAMFAGDEGLKSFDMEYDYSGGSYTVTVTDAGSSGSASIGGGYSNQSSRLRPGRHVTFKGFPMEDGSCGSSFTISNSMAISSTCKDKEAAWSFIRELLLPKESRRYYDSYGWGFPSNKTDFDAEVQEAMEVEYVTDGEGKQVLDPEGDPVQQSKGGWSWGNSLSIDLMATTQEEYDQIMELYNAIDSVSNYDTSIYEIVSDLAGSYFNGDKSLDETASLIQGRVQLYINENR